MKRDVSRIFNHPFESWSVVGREDEWKGTGRETKERSGGETKKARDKVARDSWPFSSGQANFHASLAIVRRLS